MRQREGRSLLFIDLALPRDIDSCGWRYGGYPLYIMSMITI
ncbi:hypothetical protein [Dictyobacter vulcani]